MKPIQCDLRKTQLNASVGISVTSLLLRLNTDFSSNLCSLLYFIFIFINLNIFKIIKTYYFINQVALFFWSLFLDQVVISSSVLLESWACYCLSLLHVFLVVHALGSLWTWSPMQSVGNCLFELHFCFHFPIIFCITTINDTCYSIC